MTDIPSVELEVRTNKWLVNAYGHNVLASTATVAPIVSGTSLFDLPLRVEQPAAAAEEKRHSWVQPSRRVRR